MEMVKNNLTTILLLSISSILITSSSSTPLPPVVKTVCNSSPNAPFCNSFISQLVVKNSKTATDPSSILLTCINKCIEEITIATKRAPTCKDSFVSASDFLKEALVGFKTKTLNDIQTKLTAARGDSTTCIDDLQSVENSNPTATKTAESLQNMILTCGDIASSAKIF